MFQNGAPVSLKIDFVSGYCEREQTDDIVCTLLPWQMTGNVQIQLLTLNKRCSLIDKRGNTNFTTNSRFPTKSLDITSKLHLTKLHEILTRQVYDEEEKRHHH